MPKKERNRKGKREDKKNCIEKGGGGVQEMEGKEKRKVDIEEAKGRKGEEETKR